MWESGHYEKAYFNYVLELINLANLADRLEPNRRLTY